MRTGRPKVLRKCPSCGREMGTRELMDHVSMCRLEVLVRRVVREEIAAEKTA